MSATKPRRRDAPSKREIALAEAIRDAANDLTQATNYAETYMARIALGNAIGALRDWALAGRPHA